MNFVSSVFIDSSVFKLTAAGRPGTEPEHSALRTCWQNDPEAARRTAEDVALSLMPVLFLRACQCVWFMPSHMPPNAVYALCLRHKCFGIILYGLYSSFFMVSHVHRGN